MTASVPVHGVVMPPVDPVAAASRRPRTWQIYAYYWRRYCSWCDDLSLSPWDDAALEQYVQWLATDGHGSPNAATPLRTMLQAIGAAAELAGRPCPQRSTPVVRGAVRLMRQRRRRAPLIPPLMLDDWRRVCGELYRRLASELELGSDTRATAVRDWAVIVVGWLGALRPVEIQRAVCDDVELSPAGIVLTVRCGKASDDPERIWIPRGRWPSTCPVTVLQELGTIRRQCCPGVEDLSELPLFPGTGVGARSPVEWTHGLSARGIGPIIRRWADAVSLPTVAWTGKSLRTGLATSLMRAGVSDMETRRHGRWRTAEAAYHYLRAASSFEASALAGVQY